MQIVVLAHNIRSTHNIGSILRTCEGFGVKTVYCTGYTPYPKQINDSRLPHIFNKLTEQIHKTALGAEELVDCTYKTDVKALIDQLKQDNYQIIGLEQAPNAQPLPNLKASNKVALLIGEEVHGVEADLLQMCDQLTEIPMNGQKESFNVSVATGIALYQLRCKG